MKLHTMPSLTAVLLLAAGAIAPIIAGTPDVAPNKRQWLPDDPSGDVTLGLQFSEKLSGVYFDAITGIWASQDRGSFLFLDGRYHYEDSSQFISSTGLGFRQLVPGRDIILGANFFYDSIHSEYENDFKQYGFGVEMLTRWVDARFNYYLPENDRYEISRGSTRSSNTNIGGGTVTRTERRLDFKNFETSLEGYNAEVGVLIPGLDKFAEVRAYAGYYHYNNPFGSDFDGFKARIEARVLRGVTAGVEYWDDAALMGGHWTGSIAVSVPFSTYNLLTGRNPFEGAGEYFKPLPRPFSSRMSDMVERSHRIQTTTSGNVPSGSSTSRKITPIAKPATPPPAPNPDPELPPG